MTRVDVVLVRHHAVVDGAGATLGFTVGSGPNIRVTDPEGGPLLRVEKRVLDDWYAKAPDDWTILRIDPSLNAFHDVTYADGRTGRFNGSPDAGAWELTDRGGRLLVHARWAGNHLTTPLQWICSQDGSLSLRDFLATVLTYREVVRLRRERASAIGNL